MKKSVHILSVVAIAVAVTACVDPKQQRPGLRLSGDVVEGEVSDWSFVTDHTTIFVETRTWYGIPHSVTTVYRIHKGELYVPSRDPETKRWPKNVARDPRVRLQIGDRVYERKAVLITDTAISDKVLGVAPGQARPNLVVYRMDPRER